MPVGHVQQDRAVAICDEFACNLNAVVIHRVADTGLHDRGGIHSRRILVEYARLQNFICSGCQTSAPEGVTYPPLRQMRIVSAKMSRFFCFLSAIAGSYGWW